jgi:hypothetical protein
MADDVLASEQNQNARNDAQHSQTSGDCGRNFYAKERQETSENQPQTKQEHSQVSAGSAC